MVNICQKNKKSTVPPFGSDLIYETEYFLFSQNAPPTVLFAFIAASALNKDTT